MRVEITCTYVRTKVVDVDATPEAFREEMLAEEADSMATDSSLPLFWDRTTFNNPDAGEFEDSYLGEIK